MRLGNLPLSLEQRCAITAPSAPSTLLQNPKTPGPCPQVGSCAATFMGFVFPAMLILVLQRRPRWTHTLKRSVSVGLIVLGLALFVNGFAVVWLGSQ